MRSDARRNHDLVVETAIRVLSERPQASMLEIAEASGLGRTTVYRHFPTREDLERAIFDHVEEEVRALARALIAEGAGVEDVLRRLGPAIVSIGVRYSFLMACRAAKEDRGGNPADGALLAFLSEGQRAGTVRPELPVEWMLVMLRGLATASIEEVDAGRIDPDAAGRNLGETLVATFTVG